MRFPVNKSTLAGIWVWSACGINIPYRFRIIKSRPNSTDWYVVLLVMLYSDRFGDEPMRIRRENNIFWLGTKWVWAGMAMCHLQYSVVYKSISSDDIQCSGKHVCPGLDFWHRARENEKPNTCAVGGSNPDLVVCFPNCLYIWRSSSSTAQKWILPKKKKKRK